MTDNKSSVERCYLHLWWFYFSVDAFPNPASWQESLFFKQGQIDETVALQKMSLHLWRWSVWGCTFQLKEPRVNCLWKYHNSSICQFSKFAFSPYLPVRLHFGSSQLCSVCKTSKDCQQLDGHTLQSKTVLSLLQYKFFWQILMFLASPDDLHRRNVC